MTHPAVFSPPSSIADALAFASEVLSPDHAVIVAPGSRHWEIFSKLCRDADARGNLVADAYLAALAIDWGCDWISTDGDYARFKSRQLSRPS